MRGYTHHKNTLEDWMNLLKDPRYAARAKAELEELSKIDDKTVQRAVSLVDNKNPEGEWVMESIPNPKRIRERYGLTTDEQITALIAINDEQNERIEKLEAK